MVAFFSVNTFSLHIIYNIESEKPCFKITETVGSTSAFCHIDDFAVTIFTIGNEGLETLSTFIYADARKGGLTPELRPLSTIIFVLVLVMLIVINRRSEKNKKK